MTIDSRRYLVSSEEDWGPGSKVVLSDSDFSSCLPMLHPAVEILILTSLDEMHFENPK